MPAKEKKKSQKAGRDKVKCARYRTRQTREKNKITRIMRSNGVKAVLIYAQKFGLIEWAKTRMRRAGYNVP